MVIQEYRDELVTSFCPLFQENQMLYSSNQKYFITQTHSIAIELISS